MATASDMEGKQAFRVILGLVRLFGELALLVSAQLCVSFTCVASAALLGYFMVFSEPQDCGFLVKLTVKMAAFAIVSVLIGLRLRQLYPYLRRMPYSEKTLKAPQYRSRRFLIVVVALTAGLALLHLRDYPRAEPDEMHHLIVARNLAAYGEYASGHPDAGFVRFDSYDSVGPTVIVPVAGALRAWGIDLLPARLIMVGFFVGLLLVLYALLLPLFDGNGAVLGCVFASAALGTIYMAKTLYGEIPALFLLCCALLCWRQSFYGRGVYGWLTLVGVLFGLAVVTKTFMIFALWAVLAATLYDRFTFRRVRLLHVLIPALSAGIVVGVWWGIQGAFQTRAEGVASGLLAMYQHNLMFGLGSVPQTMGWLFRHGAIVVVSALCMLLAGMWVFYRRYDPAMVVLWLFGVFVAYWWIFFTTGNIPRYVWYSLAISAGCVGPIAAMMLWGAVRKRDGRWRVRPLRAFLAVCLCVPFALNLGHEFTAALTHDDMLDDRLISDYVKALPKDMEVATTYYPVERTINFLAGRRVLRVSATKDEVPKHSVVVVDAQSQRTLVDSLGASRRIGRYAVFEHSAKE